ncbi:cell surface protein [Lactonifactor sp. BIOML-A3]|uniref:cell surface protein n=1 Tax=unclassified Lactonifactor TaxID=2636670 RepID=UPI0012B15B0E|nr:MULTISPECIES: cell surface protein [unclassified Lactonifactor]MSA02996.1 cell surface protein [Lactonifactor sp. BIOML-A5]MSA09231.1 cell surface protein [Lactonifactor sp. BIOML-A4]MSA13642.1 cell surface protein [Lactonifactor sp. BIOML-A3]MSA18224.1 cell surface protein [Lactonifactor sp. BIOML-A2]MSA39191.1 cell surface protein [Lactonifactor sp. BIOML-A1]
MSRKDVMRTRCKCIIFFSLFICITLTCACGSTKHEAQTKKVLPIDIINGSFEVDTNNKEAMVGNADYVFVGEVVEYVDTEYKFVNKTEDGKTSGLPYSNYRVQVKQNLKGNLRQDSPIDLQKAGGINKDGTGYLLYTDDILPEIGRSYVFLVYVQPTGENLVSGPNSSIPLNRPSQNAVSSFTLNSQEEVNVVEVYEDAVEGQVDTQREHRISNDDTDR